MTTEHEASELFDEGRTDPVAGLARLLGELAGFQQDIGIRLEHLVSGVQHFKFNSFEQRDTVKCLLTSLWHFCGIKPLCPKCGQVATLRLERSRKYPDGVFQFVHAKTGRRTTHQWGESLPQLEFRSDIWGSNAIAEYLKSVNSEAAQAQLTLMKKEEWKRGS